MSLNRILKNLNKYRVYCSQARHYNDHKHQILGQKKIINNKNLCNFYFKAVKILAKCLTATIILQKTENYLSLNNYKIK